MCCRRIKARNEREVISQLFSEEYIFIMIIIEISGGLGNQMFQYALGQKFISMGKEVKYDLSFYNERVQTLREFELDIFHIDCPVATSNELFYFGKGFSLASRFKQRIGWDKRNIYEEDLDLGYQPQIFGLDNIYLTGYWQSEKYFENIRQRILELYTFSGKLGYENKRFLDKIENSNSVSLHVRRGDYLNEENVKIYGGICTINYYKNAIKYISDRFEKPVFFVFTNDLEWVKNELDIPNKVIVDCNSGSLSYWDMYLMSKCKANIVANSSFSWWGAWLNQHSNRVVVSPRRWFNNHEQTSTLCDDWVRCGG